MAGAIAKTTARRRARFLDGCLRVRARRSNAKSYCGLSENLPVIVANTTTLYRSCEQNPLFATTDPPLAYGPARRMKALRRRTRCQALTAIDRVIIVDPAERVGRRSVSGTHFEFLRARPIHRNVASTKARASTLNSITASPGAVVVYCDTAAIA